MIKKFLIVFLIILFMLSVKDLLHDGLPITHDGQDHVARIANFYVNLEEGNLIPRWAKNLNWGYGHPILMFLYPFSSYFASMFHVLGLSLVDSIKLVFVFSFLASGITMYMWIKSIYGKYPATIAAILYMYAPYRFVDIYVRGAIGEHVAFIFPPLILYFIHKQFVTKTPQYIGIAFSFAALVLSHNAVTIMFIPVIFLYVLFILQRSKNKKDFIVNTCLGFLLGIGLSSFFLLPAFFEGKYTLRDIVTAGEYSSRFVYPVQFFYGQWNYGGSGSFTVQVGVIQWIIFASAILYSIFNYRKRRVVTVIAVEFLFLLTLFLMIQQSLPIWQTITIIQKFQFPWRFLTLTVFFSSILGAVLISRLNRKYYLYIVFLLLIGITIFYSSYWKANGYMYKSNTFFEGIYNGTTDTGESAPRWSVRFMEKRPSAPLEFIEGKGQLKRITNSTTKHVYEVNLEARSRFRENTLYFPGWEVLIDGKPTSIEFQDPSNRGLITFFAEKGKHVVVILFLDTKLRNIANVISIISLFVLLILYLITITGIGEKRKFLKKYFLLR